MIVTSPQKRSPTFKCDLEFVTGHDGFVQSMSTVRGYATLHLTGRRALLGVQGGHGTRTKNSGTPGQA